MKKRILTTSTAVALALCMVFLCGCSFLEQFFHPKSDEQKIQERIDKFLQSYNTGDLDGVLECLDSKTRNTAQAMVNIANNIGGALLSEATGLGLGLNLSDLFSLGIGLSSGDFLNVQVKSITITDSTNAYADITLGMNEQISSESAEGRFILIKEGDDWFIKDLVESGSN